MLASVVASTEASRPPSFSETHVCAVVSQICRLRQSAVETHPTQACGSLAVLQTRPWAQSAFVVHGSAVHVPMAPASGVSMQYFPAAQCVLPRTLRQPSAQTPVDTCEVSQI